MNNVLYIRCLIIYPKESRLKPGYVVCTELNLVLLLDRYLLDCWPE